MNNVEHISTGSIAFSKEVQFGISMEDNFFEDQLTVKENLYFYAQLKGITIDPTSDHFL
jgi:ABC-type multidrug transport system ATPase subunit